MSGGQWDFSDCTASKKQQLNCATTARCAGYAKVFEKIKMLILAEKIVIE
jgi:hypothetical protein